MTVGLAVRDVPADAARNGAKEATLALLPRGEDRLLGVCPMVGVDREVAGKDAGAILRIAGDLEALSERRRGRIALLPRDQILVFGLAAYLLPWAVLAYYLMRSREIAA